MIKDEAGRIIRLEPQDLTQDSSITLSGTSICNICGKLMPRCWDVVCKECLGIFCYDCSVTWQGHWYCLDHDPNPFRVSVAKLKDFLDSWSKMSKFV